MPSTKVKYPTKRAHFVGTSVVVTVDPVHVKRLGIDEETFFIQKPKENGIILEMYRLSAVSGTKDELKVTAPAQVSGHGQVAVIPNTPATEADAIRT